MCLHLFFVLGASLFHSINNSQEESEFVSILMLVVLVPRTIDHDALDESVRKHQAVRGVQDRLVLGRPILLLLLAQEGMDLSPEGHAPGGIGPDRDDRGEPSGDLGRRQQVQPGVPQVAVSPFLQRGKEQVILL